MTDNEEQAELINADSLADAYAALGITLALVAMAIFSVSNQ